MQPNLIENFLSKETCKYINDYFKYSVELDVEGYANIYIGKDVSYYSDQFLLNNTNIKDKEFPIIYDLLNLIKESMTNLFGFKKSDIYVENMNYRNFGPNQSVKDYHTDEYGEGDLYTALLYLNDDYEGGEIIFYDGEWLNKNNGTAYSPKPGTLIYFKGNTDYPHSINKVISGMRANINMNFRVAKMSENRSL